MCTGFVPPPPYFEAEYCLFCGRRRVAVARYRMICLVLVGFISVPRKAKEGMGSMVPLHALAEKICCDAFFYLKGHGSRFNILDS